MRTNYLFTSESVSEGHPDKVSDQISDAIVDLMLSKDPESRVACETMTTTQRVILSGESLRPDATITTITLLKLLVFPALVWLALMQVEAPVHWEALLVLTAAGPSGVDPVETNPGGTSTMASKGLVQTDSCWGCSCNSRLWPTRVRSARPYSPRPE